MCTSLCGAQCESCDFKKTKACLGCQETCGKPFGKQCFIYKYISVGDTAGYNALKKHLIYEINSLNIPGMPKINELFALNGAFVNTAYPMPSGENVKLLDDKQIYLGTQVECEFNDESMKTCFGIAAGLDFILISEYGEQGADPEIVLFKRR